MQRLQSDNALQTHCGLMMFAAVYWAGRVCQLCLSKPNREEVSVALTWWPHPLNSVSVFLNAFLLLDSVTVWLFPLNEIIGKWAPGCFGNISQNKCPSFLQYIRVIVGPRVFLLMEEGWGVWDLQARVLCRRPESFRVKIGKIIKYKGKRKKDGGRLNQRLSF